jgi:predicted secreted protein
VDNFFSVLPVGIQSKKEKFKERIDGIDPGAPNNPKIGKKFLITTIITSIIFSVIYYLVKFNLLNLRNTCNNVSFKIIYTNYQRSSS